MALCRGKYYATGELAYVESALKNGADYINQVKDLSSEVLTEVAAKHVLRDLTGFAQDKRASDYMKANLHLGGEDPTLRKLMLKAIYQGGTLF